MTNRLDQLVKQYIADCIDLECYDESAITVQEAAQKVIGFIMKEADHPYNRNRLVSDVAIIADHLQGLPDYLSIAYSYYEIIQLAIKWGSLTDESNERECIKFKDNWYNFIANKLQQMANGYHIKGIK